jgi:hypothetical protein
VVQFGENGGRGFFKPVRGINLLRRESVYLGCATRSFTCGRRRDLSGSRLFVLLPWKHHMGAVFCGRPAHSGNPSWVRKGVSPWGAFSFSAFVQMADSRPQLIGLQGVMKAVLWHGLRRFDAVR